MFSFWYIRTFIQYNIQSEKIIQKSKKKNKIKDDNSGILHLAHLRKYRQTPRYESNLT